MNTSLNVNQSHFVHFQATRSLSQQANRNVFQAPTDHFELGARPNRWEGSPDQCCCCPVVPFWQGAALQRTLMQMVLMGGMDPGSALFMLGFLGGAQTGVYPEVPSRWGPPQPPPPPPPRHSGLAERYQPGATVAVFDDFRDADNRTTHGEHVESIMMQQGLGDEDIQRFHCGEGGISREALHQAQNPRQFRNALNGYIEQSFTGLLSATSSNMEAILDDPNSQVRVINQSQGISSADVTHNLMSQAGRDPVLRARLAQDLGLPPDASRQQFVQALANRVHGVAESSPRVQAERERYEELSAEAGARGINHVISSGNNGEDATALRRLGVDVPPEFFTNALATEHTTSVGALTADGSRPASFSAPEAEIAVVGEDVLSTADGQVDFVNGTSFSAPQVAAQLARLRRQNPWLSDQEAEQILIDNARPVAGAPAQAGAGEMPWLG